MTHEGAISLWFPYLASALPISTDARCLRAKVEMHWKAGASADVSLLGCVLSPFLHLLLSCGCEFESWFPGSECGEESKVTVRALGQGGRKWPRGWLGGCARCLLLWERERTC
ncbi:hypothetical protein JOL62DRAFT_570736 [Phyllosticta paracitricarpa]|uniref:Uncharacterized protein n=1 Tax=Phyllosticta paracitricarpa TaxID=2016321 RepID=A0ABR1NBB9_9PEZI